MQDNTKLSLKACDFAIDYEVHSWRHRSTNVLVLHKEPCNLQCLGTKLLTFVFLTPFTVRDYSEIVEDYACYRSFARNHKRTWLPLGLNCGYALLPIYVGTGFNESVKQATRSTFRKHWCVLYIPSLLDLERENLCH